MAQQGGSRNSKAGRRRQEEESLADLNRRIGAAEAAASAREKKRRGRAALPDGGLALMGRVAAELVSGVAVGGFIGWLLDGWLGTTPWLMIMLLFLGAGAGMMNLWRMAKGHGLQMGYAAARKEGKKNESGRE